jgi:hypothetical protein
MLVKSINPSEGLNSQQQQANRVEIYERFAVKGTTALVFDIEPESEVILRLFIEEQVTFG